MSKRKEFELTPDDMNVIIEASKDVPYLVIGGMEPRNDGRAHRK